LFIFALNRKIPAHVGDFFDEAENFSERPAFADNFRKNP